MITKEIRSAVRHWSFRAAGTALGVALLVVLLGQAAWSQPVAGGVTSPSAAPAMPGGVPAAAGPAPITVAQTTLFRVGELPEQSAAARAALINRRIASFVNHPEQIVPVQVEIRGRERILRMAGRDLLTVTPQDAADNLTTVPELTASWQRELNDALNRVRAEHQTIWTQIRDSIFLSAVNLARQTGAFIPRLISALLVLLITIFLARGIRKGVRGILTGSHLDANTQQLVRTLVYYGIWVLGWIVALGTAGIQLSALVAGLGVTTIALGFALKDLLSNFVSGFLILTTRPFTLGDQIAVTQFEGTVERIELRATHLRTYDNRLVIIPNSDLYMATITNNTASPYRRQEFVVGIDYAADLNRARELAQRVAAETPGVLPDPAPDSLIDQLASGSVNLKVRFYSDSRRGKALTVGSAVMQRVKEAFDEAGIAIYPPGTTIVQLLDGHAPSTPTDGAHDPGRGQAAAAAAPDAPAAPRPGGASEPTAPARAAVGGPGGRAVRRGSPNHVRGKD